MNTLGWIWNRFYTICVWAFVCACNVHCTYIHWSQLKTDLISGQFMFILPFWPDLHWKGQFTRSTKAHHAEIFFFDFQNKKESSSKSPSLNKDKSMLCKTLHKDFFLFKKNIWNFEINWLYWELQTYFPVCSCNILGK